MKGAFYAYEQTMNYIANHSKVFTGNVVNRDDYKTTIEEPNGQFIGSWNRQLYKLIKTPETIPYVQLKENPNVWDNYTVYLGPKSEETSKIPMKEFFAVNKKKLSPDYASVYQTDYSQINILNPNAKVNCMLSLLKILMQMQLILYSHKNSNKQLLLIHDLGQVKILNKILKN